MPYALAFYPSFERSLKSLDPQQVITIGQIVKALAIYFGSNGNLETTRSYAPGFFYKKLHEPYYEAGIEKKIRVILEKEGSQLYAVLAGNHDQIRRFLANA